MRGRCRTLTILIMNGPVGRRLKAGFWSGGGSMGMEGKLTAAEIRDLTRRLSESGGTACRQMREGAEIEHRDLLQLKVIITDKILVDTVLSPGI